MVGHIGYEPLDRVTLRVLVERAGLVIDEDDTSLLLPLANELLEMSSAVAAFIGPHADLTPLYVIDTSRTGA